MKVLRLFIDNVLSRTIYLAMTITIYKTITVYKIFFRTNRPIYLNRYQTLLPDTSRQPGEITYRFGITGEAFPDDNLFGDGRNKTLFSKLFAAADIG